MVTFRIQNLTSITTINRYDAHRNEFGRVHAKYVGDNVIAECLRILKLFKTFRIGETTYDDISVTLAITLDDKHIYISTKNGFIATLRCEFVSYEALTKLTFKVPPNVTFDIEPPVDRGEGESTSEGVIDVNSIRRTIESSRGGIFDFLCNESGVSLQDYIESRQASTDVMYMNEVVLERKAVSSKIASMLVQPNPFVEFYYESEGLFILSSSTNCKDIDDKIRFSRTDENRDLAVAVYDKRDLAVSELSSFRMDLRSVEIGGLIMIINSQLDCVITPYGLDEGASIDEGYREIITDSLNYNLNYVLVQVSNFTLFAVSNLDYARRVNTAEGFPVRLRESGQATIDALNAMRTKCSIPVQEDKFIIRIRKIPNVMNLCLWALILILLIKNRFKNENFN